MRRASIVALVTTVLVGGAGLALAPLAQAADGRPATPEGELRSVYLHSLGRTADQGGVNTYLGLANQDCRAGVLRFSYDILTSPEAGRFLNAPDRQTNAIYMALLNRAPDPSGWATYLAMNRAEGIDRSTVDIMKSPEYRARLDGTCSGRQSPSRVGVYNGDEVAEIVQNLLTGASVGSVTCGINTFVKKMKRIKGRAALASIAAYSAQISAQAAGTSQTCKLAKQLALGAAWAAYIGSRNHPVYVYELETHDKPGRISKTIRYTYNIGWTPSDTRTFSGSVKVVTF
jgi:hypothetical protein